MKHLNRRLFLRGLGGAVVAAPFLSSVAARMAKAQSVTPPGPPRRLIMMFTHYGCLTTRWFPASSHGPLAAADYEATTLKHLAPYASKLLMPRGIRAMNEWNAQTVRGQGNDPHTQVCGSFLTCQPVTPNSDDPFSFDEATKFNAMPIGRSLDHVIAEQISASGTPLVMRVGNGNDSPMSAISYSDGEERFPGIGSPTQAFSNLTGLFQNGSEMTPDDYAAIRGKSVIDLVSRDLSTLESFDMSASDKQKLAAWKELLHSTGQSMVGAQCNEETALALGLTSENLQKAQGGLNSDITAMVTSTLDAADIYSNVAVLSAICDANRMILLKYPANYTFRGLGLNDEAHGLSHRINGPGMQGECLGGVLDMLTTIDDFYTRKFAHLVGQLDSFSEGDGTVLDNCAAVWLQEMSDGNAHNLNNLPIIQAGSCGGFFKTGQAINVEDGSATLTRGKSESVCAEGTGTNVNGADGSTRTPADEAKAPINKYYVSLMNALGVKAGPDGYALKGGDAEVTHFGMYDRSEDFVGGGTKPSLISDPGGFDALKA
jgi:hypothetical protein